MAGAALMLLAMGAVASFASDPKFILQPAAATGPTIVSAQGSPTAVVAQVVPPQPMPPPPTAAPPVDPSGVPTVVQPDLISEPPATPLLDGSAPIEELIPPVATDGRGVRPYGGGHAGDWSWGCGGSPYRTGPGMCDDWKVGCRWHVTVDGMVLSRDETDLEALAEEMEDNHQGEEDLEDATFEQFDRGPGARITFMSQVARCTGWDVMCAYEGIEAWNSSIVFEKEDFEPEFFTSVITTETVTDTDTITDTDTVTMTTTVTTTVGPVGNQTTTTETTTETETETDTETETETTTTHTYEPGPIPLQPDDPFPEGFEQRSLHYRSNYHSGELNFVPGRNPTWRPTFGVRYIKFDDEINDFTNQEAQPPLPFEGPDNVPPGEFLAVATTDRLNLVDIENNLMGFQLGLLHDSWRVNRRLSLEGFVNSGVYYNKIKFTNLMGVFTTQVIADDTSTVTVDESRIDFSDAVNNDVREYSEISYVAEASLMGVCRLNKCWALRGGYQVLWIANVHLADAAYLGDENEAEDLLFHGWHAGVECRR